MNPYYSQYMYNQAVHASAPVPLMRNRTFQQFSEQQKQSGHKFTGKDVDLYRDTPVRLLVFINDIGEAFKLPLLKWFGHALGTLLYRGTYAVTGAYVALDTADKGYKAYQKSNREITPQSLYHIGSETVGAGLFQFFAGYWIPVKIVHAIRTHAQKWVHHLTFNKFRPSTRLNMQIYLPALISAAAIPVMVKPIDRLVEKGLHHTYWKLATLLGQKLGFPPENPHT